MNEHNTGAEDLTKKDKSIPTSFALLQYLQISYRTLIGRGRYSGLVCSFLAKLFDARKYKNGRKLRRRYTKPANTFIFC